MLRSKLDRPVFSEILENVPDAWLLPEPGITTPAEKRAAYADYLIERLSAASFFVEEAARARTATV